MISTLFVKLLLLVAPLLPTTRQDIGVTLYSRDARLTESDALQMAVNVTNIGTDDLKLFSRPRIILTEPNNLDGTATPPDYLTVVLRVESAQEFSIYDHAAAAVDNGGLTPTVFRGGKFLAIVASVPRNIVRSGSLRVQAFVCRGSSKLAQSNVWTIPVSKEK